MSCVHRSRRVRATHRALRTVRATHSVLCIIHTSRRVLPTKNRRLRVHATRGRVTPTQTNTARKIINIDIRNVPSKPRDWVSRF